MQSVMGLGVALSDGAMAVPSAALVPWTIVVGLAGLAAHLCLTMALSLAPASVVVPIDFARLPVIALVGTAVYGEPLDPWVGLGALLIVGANWVNVARETQARGARAT